MLSESLSVYERPLVQLYLAGCIFRKVCRGAARAAFLALPKDCPVETHLVLMPRSLLIYRPENTAVGFKVMILCRHYRHLPGYFHFTT